MNSFTSRLLSLVLLLAFFVAPLQMIAQTNSAVLPPQGPPPAGSTDYSPKPFPKDISLPASPVLLATVNITNTLLLSRRDNLLEIAFTLTNRTGIQTGVRYGVRLVTEGPKGQIVVDEQVFDDAITLVENDAVHKIITYTAPEFLSGVYDVYLTSSNESGFPFGATLVDAITLSAIKKGVVIDVKSCTTTDGVTAGAPLSQPAVVDIYQAVQLTCSAEYTGEKDLPAIASFETRYGTIYGNKLPPVPEGAESVTFSKGEGKFFSVLLPQQSKPGIYYTKMTLLAGPVVSNPIIVRTVVKGKVGVIDNVSFDKESYKKGDTALLSLIWHGTVDSPTATRESSKYLVQATIRSESGRGCAEQFSQVIPITATQPTSMSLSIDSSCRNPAVTVYLSDPEGKTVYDTKEFSINIEHEPIDKKIAFLIITFIFVLGGIAFAINRRMKHRFTSSTEVPNGPTPPTVAIALLIVLGSTVFTTSVHADTYQTYAYPTYDIIRSTVNINKVSTQSYAPGETIQATGEMINIPENYWSTTSYQVRMEVVNDNANTRGQYVWPVAQIIPTAPLGSYTTTNISPNQSTGLYTYSGHTAWPIGTPGPYSMQFRSTYYNTSYGYHLYAGDPYDIYYNIEATPANSVDIMGDQYGVVFNPGQFYEYAQNPAGSNLEYYTFKADLFGSFPYPSYMGWSFISGPSSYTGGYSHYYVEDKRETQVNNYGFSSPSWQPGTYRIQFTAMDTTGTWRYDYANLYLTAAAQSLPDVRPNTSMAPTYYNYGGAGPGLNYFPEARNSGPVATGASFSLFFQTATGANGTGTITDHPAVTIPALSPGQSWAVAYPAESGFPETEIFYLRYCVDKSAAGSAGVITEYNENDNCTPWGPGYNYVTQCSDKVDNEDTEDSLADENDPGCITGLGVYNSGDNDETDPYQCSDGVDNADPEDTLADSNDPGCRTNGVYDPSDNDETYVGPVYQCSDGVDNADDEDALADDKDPGCHSDGDAANEASYDPNDDDEDDKKKPIYIEVS